MPNLIAELNEKLREGALSAMGEPPYWMVCHCQSMVEDSEEFDWVPLLFIGIFPSEDINEALDMAHDEVKRAFPEITNPVTMESTVGNNIALCDGDSDPPEPVVAIFCVGPEHFQLGFEFGQITESETIC